jgi:AcrR family transcriptional regulator
MARPYRQVQRAEAAEDTRRAILEAVRARLREAPAERVSVDRVARDAGVARSTVYLVFGSRAGLFDALRQDLIHRAGYERLIEATRTEDPREALRKGYRITAEMYAAEPDLFRALESMAKLDPDAVGPVSRNHEERAAGMAGLAMRLKKAGELREGVTAKRAADLMFVLTSFDAFDLLFSDRGLGVEAVAALLIETAERTLLKEG